MPTPEKIRLSSGREVWIEVTDDALPGGALEPVARSGERVAREAQETFEQALGTIEEVASDIHAALTRMAQRPDEVTVELGIKFAASAGVIIAQGDVGANLKLTLSWKNPPT